MTAETVESNGSARRFLSVAQVAAELTLAPNTVRGWLLERRLPFHKIGRRVVIARADLEQLVHRGRVAAVAASGPEAA